MPLSRTVEQIRQMYLERSDTLDASSYEVFDLCEEIERLRAERPTCEWTRDGEVYETACGDCFELTDGDALCDQPSIQWCPFCGGLIREAAEAAESRTAASRAPGDLRGTPPRTEVT